MPYNRMQPIYDFLLESEESSDNSIIVCGAGISIESGFSSGADLIAGILGGLDFKICSQVNINDIFKKYNEIVAGAVVGHRLDIFQSPRLEVLFDAIREVFKLNNCMIFDSYVRHYLCRENIISPNRNHFLLARHIKRGGIVVTFNFDRLIEKAFADLYGEDVPKVVFPLKAGAHFANAGLLIKAHGCISDVETLGINTSNLFVGGFRDFELETLNGVFGVKKNIIFFGYSISDNLDFNPYLKSTRNNYYCLVYDGEVTDLEEINEYSTCNRAESFQFALETVCQLGKESIVYAAYSKNVLLKYTEIVQDFSSSSQKWHSEYERQEVVRLLQNKKFNCECVVSIMKVFGLMNLVPLHDLKKQYDGVVVQKCLDFQENTRGMYSINLINRVRLLVKFSSFDNLVAVFGALQEYFFLQDGKYLARLFCLPFIALYVFFFLLVVFIGPKVVKSSEKKWVGLLYKSCAYLSVVFYRVTKFKRMPARGITSWLYFLSNCINEKYVASSVYMNDLQGYRFAIKHYFYFHSMLRSKSKISIYFPTPQRSKEQQKVKMLKDFQDILLFAMDTNYFIEVNNILRSAAELSFYDKVTLSSFLEAIALSGDTLNYDKVSKYV